MKRKLLALFFVLPIISHAQTCQTNIVSTTPSERFTNNTIEIITDNQTGLMWKKCSEGQSGSSCLGNAKSYTFPQAVEYVESLNKNTGFGGYTDWRLPTASELRSIVEEKCVNPSINETIFPRTKPRAFWTGSPFAEFNNYTWYVNFNQGYVNYVSAKYEGNYIRLVRTVSQP